MDARAQAIGRALDGAPDLNRTRAAVALAVQRLRPEEAAELAQSASAPQIHAAAPLRRAVERIAPAEVRELAEWVRARKLSPGVRRRWRGSP
jgi:hypothetical protein